MPPKVTKTAVTPRTRLRRGAKHEAPPPQKQVEWVEVESVSPTLSHAPSPEPTFVVPPSSKSKAKTPKKAAATPKKPLIKKPIPTPKKTEPTPTPKKTPITKKKTPASATPTEEPPAPPASTRKTKTPSSKKEPTPKKSTTSTKNTPKTITKKTATPKSAPIKTASGKKPRGRPPGSTSAKKSKDKNNEYASIYETHLRLHRPMFGQAPDYYSSKALAELAKAAGLGSLSDGEDDPPLGQKKKFSKKDLKSIMSMSNDERNNIFYGGRGVGEYGPAKMSRFHLPKELQMLCACGREGCVEKSICDPINFPWRFFTEEQFDTFEERALADEGGKGEVECEWCKLVLELGLDVPPTRNKCVRCECEPVWGSVLSVRDPGKKTKGRKKIGESAKEKKKDPTGWREGFEKRVRDGYEKLAKDNWERKDYPKGTDFSKCGRRTSPPTLKGLSDRWNRSEPLWEKEPVFTNKPKKKLAIPAKGKSPAGVKKTPTSGKKTPTSATKKK